MTGKINGTVAKRQSSKKIVAMPENLTEKLRNGQFECLKITNAVMGYS